MKNVSLILCVLSSVSFIGSGVPTTAPKAVIELKPVVSEVSLETALTLLERGNLDEAFDTARIVGSKVPALGKLSNMTYLNSLYVQGVVLLKKGQFKKAQEMMHTVSRSGSTNRSFLINHAIAGIANNDALAKAIMDLSSYVLAHPEDETTINLLGMALDRAVSAKITLDLKVHIKNYETANAILERTKPGFRHWGTEWKPQKEYDAIMSKRATQLRSVDRRKAALDSAILRLREAERELNIASQMVMGQMSQRDYQSRIRNRQARIQGATAELERAQQRAVDAKQEYQRELDLLPRPTWATKLEPVTVELLVERGIQSK
jgi:hypothetical protein